MLRSRSKVPWPPSLVGERCLLAAKAYVSLYGWVGDSLQETLDRVIAMSDDERDTLITMAKLLLLTGADRP